MLKNLVPFPIKLEREPVFIAGHKRLKKQRRISLLELFPEGLLLHKE